MEINISSLKNKVISKHAVNQNVEDGHISFKIIAKSYLALMYCKQVSIVVTSFYQKREKIRNN
jgi:hypothetical protein